MEYHEINSESNKYLVQYLAFGNIFGTRTAVRVPKTLPYVRYGKRYIYFVFNYNITHSLAQEIPQFLCVWFGCQACIAILRLLSYNVSATVPVIVSQRIFVLLLLLIALDSKP